MAGHDAPAIYIEAFLRLENLNRPDRAPLKFLLNYNSADENSFDVYAL